MTIDLKSSSPFLLFNVVFLLCFGVYRVSIVMESSSPDRDTVT